MGGVSSSFDDSNFWDPSGGKDAARVSGFSPNVNERQQRLQQGQSIRSEQANLDIQSILNQLIGGGEFQQGINFNSGQPIFGNLESQPTGPLFNIINQGLQGEQQLSQLRQQIAQAQLQDIPRSNQLFQGFSESATGLGSRSLEAQEALLGQSLNNFTQSQGLGTTAANTIEGFLGSDGTPTQFQQDQIGNIFDAQRQIGQSNLNNQFGGALRALQDQATTRGLRFNDTPIQDRGQLTLQEFLRNSANLEASLGGQQANALLNIPFQQSLQQAQIGGALQGQTQNQMLNLLNAFSTPVNQAFNSSNEINRNNQFGLQFSPQQFSAPAISNISGLTGSFNPTQTNPVFTGGNIIPLTARGGEVAGQAAGEAFGTSVGQAGGSATSAGFGGF
jgi:hypothetical protein